MIWYYGLYGHCNCNPFLVYCLYTVINLPLNKRIEPLLAWSLQTHPKNYQPILLKPCHPFPFIAILAYWVAEWCHDRPIAPSLRQFVPLSVVRCKSASRLRRRHRRAIPPRFRTETARDPRSWLPVSPCWRIQRVNVCYRESSFVLLTLSRISLGTCL